MGERMWRVEIYLPKYHNPEPKGRRKRIESAKFDETEGELLRRFGALTRTGKVDLAVISGLWEHEGAVFEDEIVAFIIYTQPRPDTSRFLHQYKQELEERFQQLEVLIILTEVEIIR